VASKADEYRRRAERCLEMAAGSPQVRNALSHMAQVWLRMADNYETRPVVQQQQQIQPKDDQPRDEADRGAVGQGSAAP
jgi:hypothetical protein